MTAFLRIDKAKSTNTPEDILSRIVRLAPGEVVGLYLLGKGVAEESWLGIWSLVCLALVLILRIWGTKSQWPSVLVSFISFGLWVLAIGDPILTFPIPDGRILSLVILVFTFLVPIFYKGTD